MGIIIFEEGNMLIGNFKNNKVEEEAYYFDNIKEQFMVLSVEKGKI